LSLNARRRIVAGKDGGVAMAKQQLSVKFDPEQLTFLERMAAREDRTISAMLRHLVAVAARQAGERASA
jgi:hypothetical protein